MCYNICEVNTLSLMTMRRVFEHHPRFWEEQGFYHFNPQDVTLIKEIGRVQSDMRRNNTDTSVGATFLLMGLQIAHGPMIHVVGIPSDITDITQKTCPHCGHDPNEIGRAHV